MWICTLVYSIEPGREAFVSLIAVSLFGDGNQREGEGRVLKSQNTKSTQFFLCSALMKRSFTIFTPQQTKGVYTKLNFQNIFSYLKKNCFPEYPPLTRQKGLVINDQNPSELPPLPNYWKNFKLKLWQMERSRRLSYLKSSLNHLPIFFYMAHLGSKINRRRLHQSCCYALNNPY